MPTTSSRPFLEAQQEDSVLNPIKTKHQEMYFFSLARNEECHWECCSLVVDNIKSDAPSQPDFYAPNVFCKMLLSHAKKTLGVVI